MNPKRRDILILPSENKKLRNGVTFWKKETCLLRQSAVYVEKRSLIPIFSAARVLKGMQSDIRWFTEKEKMSV